MSCVQEEIKISLNSYQCQMQGANWFRIDWEMENVGQDKKQEKISSKVCWKRKAQIGSVKICEEDQRGRQRKFSKNQEIGKI